MNKRNAPASLIRWIGVMIMGGLAWMLASQTTATHAYGASMAPPANASTKATGAPRLFNNRASALLLQSPPDTLTKEFTDDPVPPGGVVILSFTITNYNRFEAMSSITFTDDLDAVLPGLVAVGLPAADPCGPGSTLTGTSLLTLSGGALDPEASCTFAVTLQTPALAASGDYSNTTGLLTANVGGVPTTLNTATDILSISPAPILTKQFIDDPALAGATVTLAFAITNTSAFTATSLSFSDNLNAVLPGLVASGLPAPGFCGPAAALSGTSSLAMNSGELGPFASCTFTVTLQVPAGAAVGVYPNTVSDLFAVSNSEDLFGDPATDDLIIVGAPTLTKSFVDDPVAPGGFATLEFVLSYWDAPGAATNIAFTDDLDAALAGLVATGLPRIDVCGAGSQLSGVSSLSFTGGTVAAGSSCSFTVTVQVPGTATAGAYVNTTSNVTADVLSVATTGDPASDTLDIVELSLTKSFVDDPVVAGGAVTLQFTLTNASQISSTNAIGFTDNLNTALTGLASTSGALTDICGAGSGISGTTLLTFTAGVLAPGASCTFSVTLAVPGSAAVGEYINRTSSVSFNVDGNPQTTVPAEDRLTVVNALALAKSFVDDPASPGATTTLAFTVTNLAQTQTITDITFTDDLVAALPGLAARSGVQADICGTGSSLSGTSVLAFTGGALPPIRAAPSPSPCKCRRRLRPAAPSTPPVPSQDSLAPCRSPATRLRTRS